MIQQETYKPEGQWQCALCRVGEKQGEWWFAITDDEGKGLYYVCDNHTDMTVNEVLAMLKPSYTYTEWIRPWGDNWSYNTKTCKWRNDG